VFRDEWQKQRIAELPAGARVLDAGAGEQRLRPLCEHLNYVAQDFAQYDGKGDGIGFQTGTWDQTNLDIVSEITSIPEADGAFDAVLCIEVLEHVPDPVRALEELCRLLKPGGILLVTAPFCSLTHFAPYHFSTGFSRYFYEHHLPRLGLAIEALVPNGNYFEYLAQEIRRLPTIADKISKTITLVAFKPSNNGFEARKYSFEPIADVFRGWKMIEFAFIPDNALETGILRHADPALVSKQTYGCGCFHLHKESFLI
jgi:ubiquinone/menaquinone biosynthesis C-methylase UbiE